ncbi:hypothetical protein E2C01_098395 [Portunus trituberculatus]|uniref:Uncharacterized protein n=1 Tax=Portunus trituberculatus TaxID=210409 RepID=A0A5B7K138_PORTR|nr:hypothetical protein [Portunus trituberculatus]
MPPQMHTPSHCCGIYCRVLPVDRFGCVTPMAARLRSPLSNPDLLLSVAHTMQFY